MSIQPQIHFHQFSNHGDKNVLREFDNMRKLNVSYHHNIEMLSSEAFNRIDLFISNLKPLIDQNKSNEEIQNANKMLFQYAIESENEDLLLQVLSCTDIQKEYHLFALIILEYKVKLVLPPIDEEKLRKILDFMMSYISNFFNQNEDSVYRKCISVISIISLKIFEIQQFAPSPALCLYFLDMLLFLEEHYSSAFFTPKEKERVTSFVWEEAYKFLEKSEPMCFEWFNLFEIICLSDKIFHKNKFDLMNAPYKYLPKASEDPQLQNPVLEIIMNILKYTIELNDDNITQEIFLFYSELAKFLWRMTSFFIDSQSYDALYALWTELLQNNLISKILDIDQSYLKEFLTCFFRTIHAFSNIDEISTVIDMITHLFELWDPIYFNTNEILKGFMLDYFQNLIALSKHAFSQNFMFGQLFTKFDQIYHEEIINILKEIPANQKDVFYFICQYISLPDEFVSYIFHTLFSTNEFYETSIFFINKYIDLIYPYIDHLQQLFLSLDVSNIGYGIIIKAFSIFFTKYPQHINIIKSDLINKIIQNLSNPQTFNSFQSAIIFLLEVSRRCNQEIPEIYSSIYSFIMKALELSEIENLNDNYIFEYLNVMNRLINPCSESSFCRLINDEKIFHTIVDICNNVNSTKIEVQQTIAKFINIFVQSRFCNRFVTEFAFQYIEICFSRNIIFPDHFVILSKIWLKPSNAICNVFSLFGMQQIGDDNILNDASQCLLINLNENDHFQVFEFIHFDFLIAVLGNNFEEIQHTGFRIVETLIQKNNSSLPSELIYFVLRTLILGFIILYQSINYDKAIILCTQIMRLEESNNILNIIIQELIKKCSFLTGILKKLYNAMTNSAFEIDFDTNNLNEFKREFYQILEYKNFLNDEATNYVKSLIYNV